MAQPINAQRLVKNSREDLIQVVQWLQEHPARITKALESDETAKAELRRSVSDLFSLIEVIMDEEEEEEAK